MTNRQVPPTTSRTPAPSPAGNRAPAQLAEEGASNEELVRRLQERTARIRQAIQQWRQRQAPQPGVAAQQWTRQMQAPFQPQPNPFMAPQPGAMTQGPAPAAPVQQAGPPPLPMLPRV